MAGMDMKKLVNVIAIVIFVAAALAVALYRFLPIERVDVSSELIMYLPRTEYVSRPVFSVSHPVTERSPLEFLSTFTVSDQAMPYERRLLQEIYDEALRFSDAWEQRVQDLSEIELEYAETKLAICDELYEEGRFYDLLLHLIGLVEDAETLSVAGQSVFSMKPCEYLWVG